MSKVEKLEVTPKWEVIKALSKTQPKFKNGSELDILCSEFLEILSSSTLEFGYDYILEGVKLDTWKERVWSVIESTNLLPELNIKPEEEEVEINDTWFLTDEDDIDMFLNEDLDLILKDIKF
jgi:hypothetical protein